MPIPGDHVAFDHGGVMVHHPNQGMNAKSNSNDTDLGAIPEASEGDVTLHLKVMRWCPTQHSKLGASSTTSKNWDEHRTPSQLILIGVMIGEKNEEPSEKLRQCIPDP